jgi:hypothetical protein
VARVEAVVRRRRRSAGEPASDRVSTGEIELLTGQFQAVVAGRGLELTRREFEVLELLPQPFRCRLPVRRRTGSPETAHRACDPSLGTASRPVGMSGRPIGLQSQPLLTGASAR